MAAANAVINPGLFLGFMHTCFSTDVKCYYLSHAAYVNHTATTGHTFFSPFWRQMEPFFRFISEADITHLRKQVWPIFFLSTISFLLSFYLFILIPQVWPDGYFLLVVLRICICYISAS